MTLPENRPLKVVENRIAPGWFNSADVGPGWNQIVLDLDAELAKLFPDYRIHQIKEKFGGLCYYTESVPSEIKGQWRQLISDAETLSTKTCEECGQPGELDQSGWWRTLCGQHRAERLEGRIKRSQL